jgi:hypothetical protein
MFGKFFELWGKFPAWIRWPLLIIVAPNLVILSVLFFTMFVPWLDHRIDANVKPWRDQQDLKTTHLIEVQTLQYQTITQSIQRIEQHQGVMYQALLDRNRTLTSSDGGR